MADLNHYRQCIEKVLTNYAEFVNHSSIPLETELILTTNMTIIKSSTSVGTMDNMFLVQYCILT